MAVSKIEMPNKISTDNYLNGTLNKAASSATEEKIGDITIPSSGIWLIVLRKLYIIGRPIKLSIMVNSTTWTGAPVATVGKTYINDWDLLQLTFVRQFDKNDVINVYGANDAAGGQHTIAYNFVKLLG